MLSPWVVKSDQVHSSVCAENHIGARVALFEDFEAPVEVADRVANSWFSKPCSCQNESGKGR